MRHRRAEGAAPFPPALQEADTRAAIRLAVTMGDGNQGTAWRRHDEAVFNLGFGFIPLRKARPVDHGDADAIALRRDFEIIFGQRREFYGIGKRRGVKRINRRA